ncbi:hypothetical protein V5799_009546 [Amblyomma americanum]|uniref:M13 family peptidase n=1 Tax=Amblyomma americanum TaxID=6943 RepID=A0AAQ4FBD7_AMBAM
MRSRSTGASVLIVRKSDDQFTEDFAGQSTTPVFWFLLLTTICATLVVILCVIAIYYALIIRPRPIPPVKTVPLPTFSDYTLTRPSPEETTPEETTPPFPPETTPGPVSTSGLDPYYCTSDYCNQEAQYISTVLSHDIHPCDDFYAHVCSTWTSEHQAHSASTGSLISRDTMLQEALTRHLIEELKGHDAKDVAMAAELHATCVNWITLYPPAASNLRILFAQWTILEWPRNDPVPEGVKSVWRFAAELVRDLDLPTIAQVSVGLSPDNLDATVVELDMPRFLLGEASEGAADVAELFKQAVTETVSELQASVTNDFEDRLFTVCSSFGALRRSSYGDNSSFVAVRYGDLNHGLREFLKVLLANVPRRLTSQTSVVLRSAPYFRGDLDLVLRSGPPEDILNYLGFLVIVRLAPFLSRNLHGLQNLFADSVMGRTIGDTEDRSLLCGWLVNRALPECVAKVARQWRHSTGQDVVTREWLSQLEAVFLRHIADFSWINELSALLVRYRLKRQAVTQLGLSSGKRRLCAVELERSPHNPLMFYWNLSRHRQERVLVGLSRNSTALRQWNSAGSELSTEASFRRAFQMVHVPAALFNDSIPAKGSVFVFHLARVAVRFYRAIVQLLYENPYERDAPLSFSEETRAQLADLLACFQMVGYTINPEAASSLGRTFLDLTSALLLAVAAFDEVLPIRRIWKLDLRLNNLPDVTAHQLFFIYFALDNCESVDPAFHAARLSAKDRVNVPLRQLRQFADAFSCGTGSSMVAVGQESCQVSRPGWQHRSGSEASRRSAAEQASGRRADATASPWTGYRPPPD